MSSFKTDVVIVGGGFAGITAARELTQRGASVILLEARDRLGGRTWTRDSDLGKSLDFGGTWVHWIQPHVWAEIERYGLPLVNSPSPDTALWQSGGQVKRGTAEEMFALLDPGMTAVLADSAALFPNPYRIHPVSDQVKGIDDITVAERINELGLDDDQQALVEGMWALNFNGRPEVSAYSQGLRWCALTGGNWHLLFEACASFKLADGTKALLEAIAAQTNADIRLNARVRGISSGADGARVELTTGEVVTARQVIVTLPLNILNSIDFTPALPSDLTAVATEGQASTGCKVWVRVKGSIGHVAALGPSSCPLNFFQYEYDVDGDSLIVAFGPDAHAIDTAMTLGYRHPVGPLKTTDIVGLDVRLAIAEHLERELGPRFAPPKVLRDKVAAGELGRKTGQGFYPW